MDSRLVILHPAMYRQVQVDFEKLNGCQMRLVGCTASIVIAGRDDACQKQPLDRHASRADDNHTRRFGNVEVHTRNFVDAIPSLPPYRGCRGLTA